jgi:hypothetical protein
MTANPQKDHVAMEVDNTDGGVVNVTVTVQAYPTGKQLAEYGLMLGATATLGGMAVVGAFKLFVDVLSFLGII